jgi:hypothetical protein
MQFPDLSRLAVALAISGTLFGASARAAVAAPTPPTAGSPAEQFVLQQVALGNVADLATQFPDGTSRILRPEFLFSLLVAPAAEDAYHRHGVRIRNAVFAQSIDLRNVDVVHETWLDDCAFQAGIDLKHARFHKDLSLQASKIDGTSVAANLDGLRVDGSLFLRRAVFTGEANFNSMQIGENLEGDDLTFGSGTASTRFDGIIVDGTVSFARATFGTAADFTSARFGDEAVFESAVFNNPGTSAIFDAVSVTRGLSLVKATVRGNTLLTHAVIGGSLGLDDMQFGLFNAQSADLESANVADSIYLRRAKVPGAVNLTYMKIGVDLDVNHAQFQGMPESFDLQSTHIGANVLAGDTEFSSAVYFNGAVVGADVDFSDARFSGDGDGVDLRTLDVGRDLLLSNATVNTEFTSRNSKVGRDLRVQNSTFADRDLVMSQMSVGGVADLRGAVASGDIDFSDSTALDLLLGGPPNGSDQSAARIAGLDLSRTGIKRELRVRNISVGILNAPFARVDGPTTLEAVVLGAADLRNASFSSLRLNAVSWPRSRPSLQLSGMQFQNFEGPDRREDWRRLMELADASAFDSSTYASLESYFRRQGLADAANASFVVGKRREREEGLPPLAWFGNVLLDVFLEFGRTPGRAFVAAALIVGIGYWVFRKEQGMKPVDGAGETPHNPFWYSLDTFVPGIDLNSASTWAPNTNRRWAWGWMRFERALGWLVIPVAVAAVAGLIK